MSTFVTRLITALKDAMMVFAIIFACVVLAGLSGCATTYDRVYAECMNVYGSRPDGKLGCMHYAKQQQMAEDEAFQQRLMNASHVYQMQQPQQPARFQTTCTQMGAFINCQ